MRYVILAIALYAGFVASVSAQQQPAGDVYRANQGTVGVITGMEGGTYAQTAADLTIFFTFAASMSGSCRPMR